MELEHSFSVPVPLERAWDVLQDVERVAPCMPGATLDSVDGDSISGKIKVKVGPIQMTYAGTAKFTERDKAAGVMTLEASGKETRGAGTASASVRSELKADGDKTNVIVHTTLNVTGKPAQFGRGVLVEVGGRLIGIFADNLAAMVTADQAASASATGPASSAAAVSSVPDEVGSDSGSTAPAEGGSSGGGAVEEALPIDVLNLSSRAWSSLRQDGIQTLGDLTRRTEQQLRAIDNIGPASLSDIRRKLADRGLALADSGDKQVAAATTAVAADANGTRPAAGKHAGAEELAEVTPLRPARHESPSAPAERDDQPAWQPPNNEAIDLLGVAGLPVLKRAVPAAAGLLALLLVLLGIKRRRGRHRSQ